MSQPLLPRRQLSLREQVDENTSRSKWAFRIAVGALILALLLHGGFGLGYGIWISNVQNSIPGPTTQLEAHFNNSIDMLRSEFMEFSMNSTMGENAVVTIIQNGTVVWRMHDFDNQDFSGENGVDSTSGAYTLKNVQIGPLHFTVLVLSIDGFLERISESGPPPFGIPIPFRILGITIDQISPTIDPVTVLSTWNYALPLTKTNVDRLQVTPQPCGCTQVSHGEDTITKNGLLFTSVSDDAFRNYIGFNYLFSPPTTETTFTLSEPLELVLPAT